MGTKLWKVGHFNPLPRKEGDHRSQRVPCPVGDFNPLPRKEGDLNLFWMPDDTLISIHSLVKRETSGKSVTDVSHYDFNPLPRKEGDTPSCGTGYLVSNFNPLPRKEGDAVCAGFVAGCGYFNPLPRKEGDSKFR